MQVSATRSKLYGSLPELEKDSTLVVIGSPGRQEVVRDIDPDLDFTVSRFEVRSVLKGEASTVISIRQTGSTSAGAPAPILESGEEYLLYLTPSGLPGDLADQYYVTGLNAGMYKKSAPSDAGLASDGAVYLQADPDPGDQLPPTIDAAATS